MKPGYTLRRTEEFALRFVALGTPLSYRELGAAVGLRRDAVDLFLSRCKVIPWLLVENADGGRMTFSVDQELKDLCDLHRSRRGLGGVSVAAFFANLRIEIRRQRCDGRLAPNEILDLVEAELDKVNPVFSP